MPATWTNIVDPSPAETDALLARIEAQLGHPLHEVVRNHFTGLRTDRRHAFPRLENHFDQYLFGQFHLQTSATDHEAEFLEITLVATFDGIWSVVRIDSVPTPITDRFLARIGRAAATLDDGRTVGEVLGRLMTVVVDELERFLTETDDILASLGTRIETLADSRNVSRELREKLPVIQEDLADVRGEVVGLGSVVDRMEAVVDSVANHVADLHRVADDGTTIEMFGESTKVHLLDTWFRAQRVKVLQEEQIEQIRFLFERMRELVDNDELVSGRFMGAIASIMLVPTFLVGVYGMNFTHMPELSWGFGYGGVLAMIAAVTVFQLWFFRSKRWI